MSRDQKPGKVRVIGQRDAGAQPLRRRTDIDPQAADGTAVERAAVAEPAAVVHTGGLALVPVVLFLMCCASGGIAFTLLVLPSLPQ